MGNHATGKKTGRTFQLKEYELFQTEAGLINVDNPKSIYFDLRTHLTLSNGMYPQLIRKFNLQMENVVKQHIDTVLFSDKVIYVPLLPETMTVLGYGFVTVSFNLFLKDFEHYQEKYYKQKLETLIEEVEKHFKDQQEFFSFVRKKKSFKKN